MWHRSVRWYLLRDIQFGDDGDFQQQRFIDLVNNDLANTIGNLLNRTSSMARKWFSDAVPPKEDAAGDQHPLALASSTAVSIVQQSIPALGFKQLEAVLQFTRCQRPSEGHRTLESDETTRSEAAVGTDLYAVLEATRIVGLLLAPLLPDLSQRILEQLGQELDCDAWPEQLNRGGSRVVTSFRPLTGDAAPGTGRRSLTHDGVRSWVPLTSVASGLLLTACMTETPTSQEESPRFVLRLPQPAVRRRATPLGLDQSCRQLRPADTNRAGPPNVGILYRNTALRSASVPIRQR